MTERHGERRDHPADAPAPTITSKARSDVFLRVAPTATNRGGARSVDRPAQTLAFGHNAAGWCFVRPATTVCGDPRIAQPGHTGNHGKEWQFKDCERVELHEALILQNLPADYPVAGSRTKQFEQVGNAVPPALAEAVVRALIPLPTCTTCNRPITDDDGYQKNAKGLYRCWSCWWTPKKGKR